MTEPVLAIERLTLALPLVLLEQHAALGWPEQGWRTAFAEAVAYACGWLAFPLAAMIVLRIDRWRTGG